VNFWELRTPEFGQESQEYSLFVISKVVAQIMRCPVLEIQQNGVPVHSDLAAEVLGAQE
jgi:hypothetical protein